MSTDQMLEAYEYLNISPFHVEATLLSALILDLDEHKKTKGSNFSYVVLQLQCYVYVLAC